MANYTITLTDAQDAILSAVATRKKVTEETLVDNIAKSALVSQITQYLNEECKNKVAEFTYTEKVNFLIS